MEHIVLQQYFQGVPVFDGTLKFHFNKSSDLASLNGNFITVGRLNTIPSFSKEEAADIAIKLVTQQKLGKIKAPLFAKKTELYVFQKGLVQGYKGARHLVYEVEVRNDKDIREFLFIDAHSKATVEQFEGMSYLHRVLYDSELDDEYKKWEEGDAFPGELDQSQQVEVIASGHIYNLMKSGFGVNSYDDKYAKMVIIDNDYNNDIHYAGWNGVSAGFFSPPSDEDVAHEWAHAYMEYTGGVINEFQSGNINESYSEIWGETVDQLNGYLDEGENNAKRTACESSTRWGIGESANSNKVYKDMWNPACKYHPGKMSDDFYICATQTEDYVYSNTGVLNHAYALLVDGGTYNGQTIRGLGFTKAAHIFWHAQANYMTQTTDFAALADMLEASAADLAGINLYKLSTSDSARVFSGRIITASDVAQVAKVIAAVELRNEDNCPFKPVLEPTEPICIGAYPDHAIFYEDFESGLNGWSVSNTGLSDQWVPRNWVLDNTPPEGNTGTAFFGITKIGNCIGDGGVMNLISPVITIPAGSEGQFSMSFDHYVSMYDSDGGNISYRINGGDWILVPAYSFTANGYNEVVNINDSHKNPLEGQQAFSGYDVGKVTSSWGQSRIDLTSLGLIFGQTIQFRWNLGLSACYTGGEGWFVDNVSVYTCTIPSVLFVSDKTIVNESEADLADPVSGECLIYAEKIITVKINQAPSEPVTITFNEPTGTATQGPTGDYTVTPHSFVLEDGKLSQDVVIRINNDADVEEDETDTLSYTITGGDAFADSYNQQHILTILDDDYIPGEGTIELLYEDFNDTIIPPSWRVAKPRYPYTWSTGTSDDPETYLDPDGHPFIFVSSDNYLLQRDTLNTTIESPPFNTVGMSAINLSFIQQFTHYGGNQLSMVDVWDGHEWRNVLLQTSKSEMEGIVTKNISIPIDYATRGMKIRFGYVGFSSGYWILDNIKVTGEMATEIESEVTHTPGAQYLGPYSEAYFYDPLSKNLLARIKNLSEHDYGCTTVAIDRAGEDETDWLGAYHVTKKTFKVTPAINNPNGKYEITLYFKASELPNFNGSQIASMGKSPGNIGAENTTASFAQVEIKNAFEKDHAFTATFDTGFSGFGLSDAPPGGPLPVTLVRFEEKNTAEGNLLFWETTAEVNNDYFSVERSSDGLIFSQVGKVTGAGNSSVKNNYRFTDAGFPIGISYYRLKQVDKDGKFVNSRIISINGKLNNDLKFFPNPVQSLLTLELPDVDLKYADAKIVNTAGQEVTIKEKVKSTNGRFTLEMGHLPPGIYQVILSGKKKNYHVSVLKL
ncbi:M4 family metallopeptidase [Dyadobacter sp. NIV53]|uniref:M4 family metallopeptidase n=1 Tax=Dyadobacter sp. NIV53 TaxID=2861765 RepID=UPI001C867029|nr:M4 family metallopeptidase [Dyadobacter sp. NIV53]